MSIKEFIKTRNARVILWTAIVIIVALFLWLTAPKGASKVQPESAAVNTGLQPAENINAAGNTNTNAPKAAIKKPAPKPVGFTEKKTPHYVSANVANNATLAMQPATVTITFDAPIIKSNESYLTVKRDQIYSAAMGNSYIGGDGKTLSLNINPQTQSGDYFVYYVACFADTGCKDGRFGYHLKLP